MRLGWGLSRGSQGPRVFCCGAGRVAGLTLSNHFSGVDALTSEDTERGFYFTERFDG